MTSPALVRDMPYVGLRVPAVPEDDPRARELGAYVKERRLDLGLKRPDFVAEVYKNGVQLSPDYLAKLETGVRPLNKAALEIREAMRLALGIPRAEWKDATGLYVPPEEPAGGRRHAPPVLEPDDPPGKAMSIDLMPAGCGPALESDERIGTISIPEDMARGGKRLIALRAEGTSMTPELDHGDIAIAAIDDGLCQPGDLCPIYLPDEGVVIKRFVRELRDGTLLLESLNPAEGQEAVFEAPAGSRVLGKAVFVIKSL